MLRLQNQQLVDINYFDFVSTATSSLTLSSGASSDVLLGGSGDDIATTGAGDDVVVTYGGNDTITVDGTGTKTINGGAGLDHLIVNTANNRNLTDYVVTYDQSTGYITFTASDEVISVKDVERYTFNGAEWIYLRSGENYNPDGSQTNEAPQVQFGFDAFFSVTSNTIQMFDEGSLNNSQWIIDYGFTAGDNLTVLGSEYADEIRLTGMPTINEATINSGAGNDTVIIYNRGDETDTVNLGAGDDFVRVGTDYATDTLDGGDGTDTVSFRWTSFADEGFSGATFALGTNATNFENIEGSAYSDTLTGDDQANVISGDSPNDSYGNTGDTLYGLGGDDTLIGGVGNDTLDGGTGADTITTGADTDTIVTRSGDGGSSIDLADTVTDFTDGTDIIGLDGISYNDLTIEQGTGSYSNDVIVKCGAEYLLILKNTSISDVTDQDFTPI